MSPPSVQSDSCSYGLSLVLGNFGALFIQKSVERAWWGMEDIAFKRIFRKPKQNRKATDYVAGIRQKKKQCAWCWQQE